MSIINLTPAQLRKAADLQERIVKLQNDLAELMGAEAPVAAAAPVVKAAKTGKHKMSAEGRARIAAAQKARWAKAKGKTVAPAAKPVKKARKKISAEGIARIKAAQKARWAKVHAEKAAK
jgi:hypothetical protein